MNTATVLPSLTHVTLTYNGDQQRVGRQLYRRRGSKAGSRQPDLTQRLILLTIFFKIRPEFVTVPVPYPPFLTYRGTAMRSRSRSEREDQCGA